jgi:hypothetical protein
MKLYPYSKIKTEKLGILLFSARALAVIGMIMVLAGIFFSIVGLFYSGPQAMGNGMTMRMPWMAVSSIISLIFGVFSGLVVLAFSGICAAIVSRDNKS